MHPNTRKVLRSWPRPKDASVSVDALSAEAVAKEAQPIVSLMNSVPFPYAATPAQVRTMRAASGNPFDFPALPRSDVETDDIVIPTAAGGIPARIFKPVAGQKFAGLAPCLVYYHGGGFVLGDVNSYHNMAAQLALESGVIVISVDYRLAPEHPFPGPVEDAYNTYQWISKNATRLGIDPGQMAIGGDSAGANLATVVCHLLRDKRERRPALQLLIYPSIIGNDDSPSRQAFSKNLLLTEGLIRWFHSHYIHRDEQDDPRFNVANYLHHRDLPPAFVLTAGFDPLRDEGYDYAMALKQDGVLVQHRCYTDMIHGFINLGKLPQAQRAVSECAELLKKSLKPWWWVWS